VTFQTIIFPVSDSSQTSVFFLYRIDRSFFAAQRIESVPSNRLELRGELLVEFTDKKTSIVTRQHRTIREFVEVPAPSRDAGDDLQGFFKFPLQSSEYMVAVELKDICSNRHFSAADRVLLKPFPADTPGISAAVFVSEKIDRSLKDSLSFILFNRGNTIPFAGSGGLVVQMKPGSVKDSLTVSWTISPIPGADEDLVPCSGTAFTVLPAASGIRQEHNVLSLCTPDHGSGGSSIYIPLPLDKLEPASYFLKIKFRERERKLDHEITFRVVWINKPFSLSDRHIVLDALRSIASDDEIEHMSTAVGSNGWKAFLTFWKKRSPDSTRAFNPVMAEYYRRVDETIRRFSTDNAADGFKNDRGRIFILFGSPSAAERKFNPKSDPAEIWTYSGLHKRFIFNDLQHSGIYTLTKVEEF
jgi:GWxTD domain-containing protein